MKKITFFAAILSAVFMLAGCVQNGNNDTVPQIEFKEGWYKYEHSEAGISEVLFIKFDSAKNIERMGNELKEYTGAGFTAYTKSPEFTWDALAADARGASTTFKKVDNDDLPEWAVTVTVTLRIDGGGAVFWNGTTEFVFKGKPGEKIDYSPIIPPSDWSRSSDYPDVRFSIGGIDFCFMEGYMYSSTKIENDENYELICWGWKLPKTVPDKNYLAVLLSVKK